MKRLLLILVWIFCAACTTLGTPAPTQIISHSAVPTVQSLLLWQPESREVWLRSVDPGNGQDAAGKPPLRLSSSESMPAVSPLSADEKRLAVAYGDSSVCEPYAGGSRCMGEHQGLALVDVPAWLPQEIELPGGGWVSLMAFSPDSSRLALVYHQPEKDLLLLMNASSGALLASRELPFTAEWMAFVLGGSGLAAFGSSPGKQAGISPPEAAQVLLLDSATLEPAWQHALAGVLSGQWCLENCEGSPDEIHLAYFRPAIALSPDRNHLYVVPAGAEIITHLDLKTHTSRTIPIQPQQSWLDRLLALTAGRALAKTMPQGAIRLATVSPDGQIVYIATQRLSPEAQYPPETTLQAVNLGDGTVIAQAESRSLNWPARLILTPDGAELLLVGFDEDSSRTEIYTPRLELAGFLDGWQISPTRRLDGSPLLLGSDQGEKRTRLGLADDSFEIYRPWQADGLAWWIISGTP